MNIAEWIGEGKELTIVQMSIRAIIVFIITLVLLRFAGRRAFGMGSAFDNVISILLGAVLSRAVVGASPFLSTVAGASVIVALYRFFGWLSVKSGRIGKLIKGEAEVIYADGKVNRQKMEENLLSEKDLLERIRREGNTDNINNIDKAYLERDGAISVILKRENNT